MSNSRSPFCDRQFATKAAVAADVARIAPICLRSIPDAAILLLTALAHHDGGTYTHSLRVSRLAWKLSLLLGDDEEQAQSLFLAGLLHDIGKIDLPRSILQKPAPLTATEWSIMTLYPQTGARLIRGQSDLASLAPIILSHQERPDGMGYPHGLLRPDISLAALRVAVADAADAMKSYRPYAAAMTVEEIREELLAGAGACWDYAAAVVVARELLTHPSEPMSSHWAAASHVWRPVINLSK